MLNLYLVFEDYSNVYRTFKSICEDEAIEKHKNFSSFGSYLDKYILNMSLKSQHNQEVLDIICRVVDEYLQSLPLCQK